MTGALAHLKDLLPHLTIDHQTGFQDYEPVKQSYEPYGVKGEVAPFFKDMGRRYQKAHLYIGRAGATTLSELTALGLGSILIPYPYATHNHQEINARVLEKEGAAKVILEKGLTPEVLAAEIRALLKDGSQLEAMGTRARALGKTDAAERILDEVMKMVREKAAA
jgi:UDP-N-acetylglucosamine--N-acetylmuramyl-(pentapeptide) pyrophosphoryl-undecaprenol N-acetylglucosamine transferase